MPPGSARCNFQRQWLPHAAVNSTDLPAHTRRSPQHFATKLHQYPCIKTSIATATSAHTSAASSASTITAVARSSWTDRKLPRCPLTTTTVVAEVVPQ